MTITTVNRRQETITLRGENGTICGTATYTVQPGKSLTLSVEIMNSIEAQSNRDAMAQAMGDFIAAGLAEATRCGVYVTPDD